MARGGDLAGELLTFEAMLPMGRFGPGELLSMLPMGRWADGPMGRLSFTTDRKSVV